MGEWTVKAPKGRLKGKVPKILEKNKIGGQILKKGGQCISVAGRSR